MNARALLEMQNTEEAIDTAEKLNDEEICDLVMSANAEALKTFELQADECHATTALALAFFAGARAHIDALIEFLESRHEGLSENDSLKHIQHLNEMRRSLTNAGEMSMKQTSVQSFFQQMS
jgi:hypothetical protein